MLLFFLTGFVRLPPTDCACGRTDILPPRRSKSEHRHPGPHPRPRQVTRSPSRGKPHFQNDSWCLPLDSALLSFRAPCVTCYGQILMTVVVGAFLLEELDTHSAKISPRRSTTPTDLLLSRAHISSSWKVTIGVTTGKKHLSFYH